MSDLPDTPALRYGGREIALMAVLGKGSEGTVYRARIRQPDRSWGELALKVSNFAGEDDPDFGSEGDVLAASRGKIRNTIIPSSVYPLEAPDGSYRQACHMPLAKGSSLSAIIDHQRNAFDTCATVNVLAQIGQTISDAAREGHVHADIKPGNVMYDPATGKATVVDWGMVAKPGTPQARGTYLYMAPEVARSKGLTPESDVYSAAMTAAAMITGKAPKVVPSEVRRGGEHAAILWTGQYEGMPQIKDHLLRAVIHRAAHPDPAKRSTPTDLLTDLAAYPEARQHYQPEECETLAQHLVARASDLSRRHSLVDANAARGLAQALPKDHPLQKNLAAVASLGPVLVEQEPRQQAATPQPVAPARTPTPAATAASSQDVTPSFRSTMRR